MKRIQKAKERILLSERLFSSSKILFVVCMFFIHKAMLAQTYGNLQIKSHFDQVYTQFYGPIYNILMNQYIYYESTLPINEANYGGVNLIGLAGLVDANWHNEGISYPMAIEGKELLQTKQEEVNLTNRKKELLTYLIP